MPEEERSWVDVPEAAARRQVHAIKVINRLTSTVAHIERRPKPPPSSLLHLIDVSDERADHKLICVIIIILLFIAKACGDDQRAHLQACERRRRRGSYTCWSVNVSGGWRAFPRYDAV